MVPILHLNGYKIASPTVLARIPDEELTAFFRGHGYDPILVAGDDPALVHPAMAAALDRTLESVAAIQRQARTDRLDERPIWPMIVLRTPKGWTGPRGGGRKPTEGSWRSHQVPFGDVRTRPDRRALMAAGGGGSTD